MKVLITGAYGLLGSKICELFVTNTDHKIFGLVRDKAPSQDIPGVIYQQADLTESVPLQTAVEKIKPEVIIHCAANVNLNDCEKNKEYTEKLHAGSTKQLASFPGLKRFIYISTDSVFNGQEGNYTEAAVPDPLNYYAATKLLGEQAALDNCSNTVIVRTNIYGLNKVLKNSLAEWGLKNILNGETISGFTDVVFNPVSTDQLAKAIQLVLADSYTGIINVAAEMPVSKYDFLVKLAEKAGRKKELIKADSIKNFPSAVLRPMNTSLNSSLFKEKFRVYFTLDEGLGDIMREYKLRQHEKN